jgi:lysosomal alpha-mannosidase
MDDPELEDYNVPDVVARFEALIADQLTFTAGQDTMIMMATDFSGENAQTWFRNIDKLIHHVNANGKINLLYSTPSIYTAAKIASTPLPVRDEDVMPYFDDAHAVWTGYFSSRMALKHYVRDSSRVFQAAKQLQAAAMPPADMSEANPLYLLERAMAVTQHHDAVSGTSKQHVANDYARRLAGGRLAADQLVSDALASLTGYKDAAFVTCDLANVTICPLLEAAQATVLVVYNQLAQDRLVHVRVPVGLPSGVASYKVFNSSAGLVASQLSAPSATDAALRAYYSYSSATPVAWLTFNAQTVPALGFTTFFLQPSATREAAAAFAVPARRDAPAAHKRKLRVAADTVLSNGLVSLTFDGTTGLLSTFASVTDGISTPFTQNFFWWNSSTGNFAKDGTGDYDQRSGAYIFRPNNTVAFNVAAGPVALTVVSSGPVVWEARQVFADWASQTVRLWAGSSTLEFEYDIGPIPFADGLGKEIVSRFTASAIASAKTWTSDSNGRDAQVRVRDHRRSFNYQVYEPVAGNFVPVNLFTALADSKLQMSIAVDRSQAGASLMDGALELMIHRRILADDSRGVGEPHNETGLDGKGLRVRGVHRVEIAPAAAANERLRAMAGHSLFREHLQFAANKAASPAAYIAANKVTYSMLAKPLPANLHVVTLHAQSPTMALVRIAHMLAVGEGALSAPASVDLATLFSAFRIVSAEEMILPGTVALTSAPVSTFLTRGGENFTLPVIDPAPAGPGLTITLSAMQIRTFRCQIAY